MRTHHDEHHKSHRAGWLRAAVLGANDGLISTASIIIGVAAAAQDMRTIALTGGAALVAGAMSMAAGEYVSVSSQADAEKADLEKERAAIADNPQGELMELAGMLMARGAEKQTALDMARQLSEKDALAAHAREELNITDMTKARPFQAAWTSALSFAIGAALPLILVHVVPHRALIPFIAGSTLIFLALLGAIGAQVGGAPKFGAILRVTFWGAIAMAITAGVGLVFGATA